MAETTPGAAPRKTARKSAEKATAEKTTAKKSTAKKAAKTPAKKTAVKKTATSKAATKRAPSGQQAGREPEDTTRNDGDGGGSQGRRGVSSGGRAALLAAQQLVDLTGKEFEGIVGMSKSDDGWSVQVEILEVRRIPDTTDVLAVYEVAVDRSGDLVEYRRTDRYTRGSAGEDRR